MAQPNNETPITYLLVDGENIDATLGNSLLNRRPAPDERPRWERLSDFVRNEWGNPVRALFFLNASSGNLPMSFIQALNALDYRPIPLTGSAGEKVVDIGIQRTLRAIAHRPGDVVLTSHDGDFLEDITDLVRQSGRRVAVAGFREFFNAGFSALTHEGLEIIDLEGDVNAFQVQLPRVRPIPLESFDPEMFL